MMKNIALQRHIYLSQKRVERLSDLKQVLKDYDDFQQGIFTSRLEKTQIDPQNPLPFMEGKWNGKKEGKNSTWNGMRNYMNHYMKK